MRGIFYFIAILFLGACANNVPPYHIPNLPIASVDGFAFSRQILDISIYHPTVMQFGADERLYIAQDNGTIMAFTFSRYTNGLIFLEDYEEISTILSIPNHNDDGSPNPRLQNRLITGLVVTGTSQNPVLYVSSSDPRSSTSENFRPIDTNSGIISRLTWTGVNWEKVDIVRGLPRSFLRHASNGLVYDTSSQRLYLAQGGNTNMGTDTNAFYNLPEYPYSAAILQFDLDRLEAMPRHVTADGQVYIYDLPTLDDPNRENDSEGHDIHDPFGGNRGANQAILSADSPVQVYATGFRNPYKLVLTSAGYLYTVDSGAIAEGAGACSNGLAYHFHLHLLSMGFYGGHPNPSRSECTMLLPPDDGSLLSFDEQVFGFAEYQARIFDGRLNGALLFPSFDGSVLFAMPDTRGQIHTNTALRLLFNGLEAGLVDIAVSPMDSTLTGTIWLINQPQNQVITFSPINNFSCDPNHSGDLDQDRLTAEDERAAGTDPCSANETVDPN